MYTEDYKFSERLKTLRKSKKLTQVQISELIGVQQGTYSRWGEWNVRTRIRIRCEISKYLWDYYRLFAGTKTLFNYQ